MTRLPTPVVDGQLPPLQDLDDNTPEEIRKILAGLNSPPDVGRAIAAAQQRGSGGPQTLINPFVNGPDQNAVEDEQAVRQLLGNTENPEQRREIQRVLQATEDRVAGRSTAPQDLFPEHDAEAENIARWATNNNVSKRRVDAAMKQLRTAQSARTGMSQTMAKKAQEAASQQQALAEFKQAQPDMADFAFIDPESGQPAVNKDALDSRIKLNKMQQDQEMFQAELKQKRIGELDKAFESRDQLLAQSMGIANGPPDEGEIRLQNAQSRKAAEPGEGGTGGGVVNLRNFNQEMALYEHRLGQHAKLQTALGRQIYGDVLSDEQLDVKFPLTGLSPSILGSLDRTGLQALGFAEKVAKAAVPLPNGKNARSVAREMDVHFVPNKAVLERMLQSGVVNVGDTVVTPTGIMTVEDK